jgi:hypothetical protein
LVVKNDQTFANHTVQVTVDNTPPTAKLATPTEGQQFTLGSDESVIIQPDAADNLSLAYVEIFVDGEKVETSTVAPFTFRWKLGTAGQHSIYIRAVDAAGNSVESGRVVVTVQER